jgi:hypothetical protein
MDPGLGVLTCFSPGLLALIVGDRSPAEWLGTLLHVSKSMSRILHPYFVLQMEPLLVQHISTHIEGIPGLRMPFGSLLFVPSSANRVARSIARHANPPGPAGACYWPGCHRASGALNTLLAALDFMGTGSVPEWRRHLDGDPLAIVVETGYATPTGLEHALHGLQACLGLRIFTLHATDGIPLESYSPLKFLTRLETLAITVNDFAPPASINTAAQAKILSEIFGSLGRLTTVRSTAAIFFF